MCSLSLSWASGSRRALRGTFLFLAAAVAAGFSLCSVYSIASRARLPAGQHTYTHACTRARDGLCVLYTAFSLSGLLSFDSFFLSLCRSLSETVRRCASGLRFLGEDDCFCSFLVLTGFFFLVSDGCSGCVLSWEGMRFVAACLTNTDFIYLRDDSSVRVCVMLVLLFV